MNPEFISNTFSISILQTKLISIVNFNLQRTVWLTAIKSDQDQLVLFFRYSAGI